MYCDLVAPFPSLPAAAFASFPMLAFLGFLSAVGNVYLLGGGNSGSYLSRVASALSSQLYKVVLGLL